MIITNQEKLEQIKSEMKKGGVESLHILADFDRTLTKMFVNGKKVWSLLGVLRETDIMPQEYKNKAQELFNYYHPLEIDSSLTKEEKKKLMDEWWIKAFNLMIEFGFSKSYLRQIIDLGLTQFRDGYLEFFDTLKKNNIQFENIDVGVDPKAGQEMIEKSGQMGVPVLDIDGQIIVGFDKDAISRALGLN